MAKLSKYEIERQLNPKPKRKKRERAPLYDCGTPFTAGGRSQEIDSDPILEEREKFKLESVDGKLRLVKKN